MKELITSKPKTNAKDPNMNALLFKALDSESWDMVNELITKGADVNARKKYEITPLHIAATKGQLNIVKTLIAGGADVNATSISGHTPLMSMTFSRKRKLSIMKELIAHGANVNIKAKNNLIAQTAVWGTVLQHDSDMLKELIAHGADVDAEDEETLRTPLHLAATHGYTNIIRLLLAAKANINQPDNQKYTPLHMAVLYNKSETVQQLIDHGAEVNTGDHLWSDSFNNRRNVWQCRNRPDVVRPWGRNQYQESSRIYRAGYGRRKK